MNILKMAGANIVASGGNQSLYSVISGLGLTTNLKLCLDAGDSASYDPAVQTDKWLDTSGNGYDFFRGSGTGSDAADPTFNGTAGGLSSAEYWSFDGADYFRYDTTVETWMQNISRNNALWSAVIVYYPVNSASPNQDFIGTRASGAGFVLRQNASEQLIFRSGQTTFYNITLGTVPTAQWVVVGIGLNEATGTNGCDVRINGTTSQVTSTYTEPSTSGELAMNIGAEGTPTNYFLSGARLACLAIWEGTALTSTNLTDIYNGIKGRFGL
jgi:hypothetical protein